jgi:raffinose/stachyose/melibiose transport system substrate-binding protein
MKKIALAMSALALLAHGALAQDVVIDMVHVQFNPDELKLMDQMAAEYQAAHPGIKINIRKFGGEDYKSMLTTSLQSNEAPDVIYSWGGGVLTDQVKAGLLRPITGKVPAEVTAGVGAVGVDAFSRNGELYGIAQNVSEVVFWYNKALFKKAGVDVDSMADWDGFLAGVKKLKDAGIAPIAMGSKDKWPAAFFWDYLAIRLAGRSGMEAARAGNNGGFATPEFVRAGNEFLRLSQMNPFQNGFEASGYASASGMFGDGQAAMILMGDWNYQESKTNSVSKQGLPDDQLGFLHFPAVSGQKGNAKDTLGGVNGWVFSKNAPDEAVDFMVWYQKAENVAKFAAGGYYIPINPAAAGGLANPFLKQIAKDIGASPYHAIFFDQSLGLNAGNSVNDASAAMTSKAISAEGAAQEVEDAMALDR